MIGTVDSVARGLAVAGILVALVSPMITLLIWRRSGSRLRLTLRHEALTSDRMADVIRIEVHSHGSQPVVVRRISLGWRVPGAVVNNHQQYTNDWFVPDLQPTDEGGELRRQVMPTDYVTVDVPIRLVGEHCGWGKQVLLLAQAKRGDDKVKTSKVVKVQLPKAI